MRIINNPEKLPDFLLDRSQLDHADVSATVADIIADVRKRGDAALMEYSRRFDKAPFEKPEEMLVTRQEIDEAYTLVDEDFLTALKKARDNIIDYHEKQLRQTWIDFQPGKALGQKISPLRSAGIYVPGGTAGYPSSVLMNMLPAKVAGVRDIVMVTPPGADGKASFQAALVAADICGVERIYKAGGAQAVAALAFGTETIPRVDKIVGPGNIYVANAKRQVFGHVGIDMIAGPSEILIIADGSASPAWVAADLLSQAEHDELSAAVLVCLDADFAQAVSAEVDRQCAALPRKAIAQASLDAYGAILVAKDMEQAFTLANAFAPEHMELCLESPFEWLGAVENAGAVFLGHYAPEPLGDYFAGPNHVLPTSGTARFFSPLSVDDFVKKTSIIHYSADALREVYRDVEVLALGEGLHAHARASKLRFTEESENA